MEDKTLILTTLCQLARYIGYHMEAGRRIIPIILSIMKMANMEDKTLVLTTTMTTGTLYSISCGSNTKSNPSLIWIWILLAFNEL